MDEYKAVITIRNISAAPLNGKAEHLAERFIRGDDARSTEGSGLGLAIVKSFMELQGGSCTVSVDGDLFKVTLTLPLASQQPE
jgi:signal transduction histidine kinase